MTTNKNKTGKIEKIAALNDLARKSVMMPVFGPIPCKVYMTQGISSLPPEDQINIAALVREFDDFTDKNDPYGERDFGAFDYKGKKVFWKIDYFDRSQQFGSKDPSDPEVTTRVLTILLASEY